MKRAILLGCVLSFSLQSSYAQSGGWGRSEPATFGDFMCGLIGGAIAGKLAHEAFRSDPVTFVISAIGYVASFKLCQSRRDEEKLSVNQFVKNVADRPVGSWDRFKSEVTTSHYGTQVFAGYVGTLAEGTRRSSQGDSSGDQSCKLLRFVVYRGEVGQYGQFVGHSQTWVCRDFNGNWEVARSSEVRVSRGETGSSRPGAMRCGSDQDVGIVAKSIRFWQLESLPRMVQHDPECNLRAQTCNSRSLQMVNRKRNFGENFVEVGFFAGRTPDNKGHTANFRGVVMYINGNDPTPIGQPAVHINNVGVECGVTPYCHILEVETAEGFRGEMTFLFGDGNVVIENRGDRVIRHVSTLRLCNRN
ncbi:MAG: hypothetical protein ACK5Y2_06110 [Bdellovibrionales bacterium]